MTQHYCLNTRNRSNLLIRLFLGFSSFLEFTRICKIDTKIDRHADPFFFLNELIAEY